MPDKNKIILGTNDDTYIAADDAGNIVLQHEGGNRVSVTNTSITPSSDEQIDLGSATNKFKDLYLSSDSIYIGNTKLSSDPATGALSTVVANESGEFTAPAAPVGGGGGLEGTQYVYVAANGTDVENAAELQEAYNTASALTVSSTVIAGNGLYNFSSDFVMDTENVDLVSLDGNKSIIFNGLGTLSVEADNLFVKGVDVQLKAFKVLHDLPNITIENCSGGEMSFDGTDPTGSSNPSNGTLSGNFINCTGKYGSFGYSGMLSGNFTNCTAENGSFGGGEWGMLTGNFTNCTAGNDSFGRTAAGTFTDCNAGSNSFAGYNPIYSGPQTSGIFVRCTAGDQSFASSGNGDYERMAMGDGTFTNCTAGAESFAGNGGFVRGTYDRCTADSGSFGGPLAVGWDSSAYVYFCRLTSGQFLSGPGQVGHLKVVQSIHGNTPYPVFN